MMLEVTVGGLVISILRCDNVKQKGVLLGVSAIIALLVVMAFEVISDANGFQGNIYRASFVFAAVFSALSFFVFRKDLGTKPENVFLCCV